MERSQIKVLAIDLDGTLLNKQNVVSEENIKAIVRARELGILVVPCTGRLLCESRFAIDAIGGCEYSLHCNGSIILNHLTGKPIALNLVSPELADRVIAQLERYNVLYQIYVNDASCCPTRFYKDFTPELFNAIYADMFRDTQLWLDDPCRDIRERNLDVVKFYVPNKDEELLARVRADLTALDELDATFSSQYSLEIFRAGMDKENGLAMLLKHLGLGFENLMMIGDSENDLRAIKRAQVGVAMDNALDFIKAEADFVTRDRGESGVAHAINTLLLEPAGCRL